MIYINLAIVYIYIYIHIYIYIYTLEEARSDACCSKWPRRSPASASRRDIPVSDEHVCMCIYIYIYIYIHVHIIEYTLISMSPVFWKFGPRSPNFKVRPTLKKSRMSVYLSDTGSLVTGSCRCAVIGSESSLRNHSETLNQPVGSETRTSHRPSSLSLVPRIVSYIYTQLYIYTSSYMYLYIYIYIYIIACQDVCPSHGPQISSVLRSLRFRETWASCSERLFETTTTNTQSTSEEPDNKHQLNKTQLERLYVVKLFESEILSREIVSREIERTLQYICIYIYIYTHNCMCVYMCMYIYISMYI